MPTQLEKYAIEKSAFAIIVGFYDEEENPVIPDSVTWTLIDTLGAVINNRQDVSETPAQEVTVLLTGDDLLIRNQTNEYELRYLEVSAVIDTSLGSNIPIKDRATFRVLSLESIS